MNIDRTFQTSITWLSGGLVVAILAFFGLSTGSEAVPAKTDVVSEVSDSTYPIVSGAISLASSMWDDPFVHLGNEKVKSMRGDSQATEDQAIKDLVADRIGEEGKIMFLVVPVDEGFDSENIESRRRTRHAMELAMANQGFSLSFPDRMTYRKATYNHYFSNRSLTSPDGTKNQVMSESACYLPTKLYSHKDDHHFVLVTWIQNSHLGKHPLDTLREVIQPVVPEASCDRASFCLLGPPSSDTLSEIVSDAKGIHAQSEDRLRIENGKASNPPEASRETEPSKETEASKTQAFFGQFKKGGVICNVVCTATNDSIGLKQGQTSIELGGDVSMKIFHTIGSDGRLLSALQRELNLRGVLPSSDSLSQMILFIEQGSLSYINDLQTSFAETGGNRPPVVIPYLKGIASDLAESENDGSTSLKGTSSVQDYLDRSMSELSTLSSSRGINPSRVRAVGIIGSNWEDKNLILMKARGVFPVATFFTTELDARYNLPRIVPHARNLIVASHYGLLINGREDIFGRVNNIPSFRDGYQTSGFIGTSILCYAFRNSKLKEETFEKTYGLQTQDLFDLVGRSAMGPTDSPGYLSPLTFEIGSRSPVQLGSKPNASYLPLRQPPPVSSILDDWRWIWMILISAVGGVLCLNFLARFSSDLTKFKQILVSTTEATWAFVQRFVTGESVAGEYRAIWSIVIGVLLVVFVALAMIISDFSLQSEPILIGSGVSLWPPIWGLTLIVILSLRSIAPPHKTIPVDINEFAGDVKQPGFVAALKLAITITIAFYLISYIESGVIQPPARDWFVRWLAVGVLLAATLGLLTTTFNSLLFCLYARRVITNATDQLPDAITKKSQVKLVQGARCTMHLSIVSSRQLIRPAVLSILLIAARWRGWDAWGLDRSWYILLALPIIISFIAAIVVRISAIRYRTEVVERMRQAHYALVCKQKTETEPDASLQNQIELLQESEEEITRLQSGPFGPLSQDYLLGAGVLVLTIALTGPASVFFTQLLAVVP